MQFLVMMGFMFILVYFLTIRPQKKKQQELEAQIKALKTGDRIITSSGIHGVIANVRDEGSTTLSLKVSDDVKIEIEKSAIATIVREKSANPKA
jgi:preprotein translocase subunit YajC